MLLFFFMVVTVIKKDDDKKEVDIPNVSYAEQLKKHNNYLLISAAINENGTMSYFNGKQAYSSFDKFKESLINQSQSNNSEGIIKAKMKIDTSRTMGIVNKIKRALQDNEIFKMEYMIRKDIKT
jgi:biopolymer transport protein ExbD